MGNTRDGGLAEYALVPAAQLVPWERDALERAVWLEPLACVLHAIQVVDPAPGASALILGAGVLGNLMVRVLSTLRGVRLAVMDPNPEKVERALEQGADAGWVVPRSGPAEGIEAELRGWTPAGPDLLIDTTGAPAAIERAIRWAAPRAKILLFGVSNPEERLSLDPSLIFSKELLLTASAGMTPDSFDRAERLLRSGSLTPENLVSQAVDLEQAVDILLGRPSGMRSDQSEGAARHVESEKAAWIHHAVGKVLVRSAGKQLGREKS
jgi:threonine dehydrogenase-like Zn-dependent dehydrogenase